MVISAVDNHKGEICPLTRISSRQKSANNKLNMPSVTAFLQCGKPLREEEGISMVINESSSAPEGRIGALNITFAC
ncbi:hypothetical protein ED28_14740 [[Pantoea] beijingensis]|uniref:Uncharacterized protein n=1 Tax=[Pantoea] beijingensis TaxID=1324864 RepID=A0A443IAZ1_9GAMM|nr:hypothetical protein ED28_14740 [[Pantoea] beijingensis]